MKSVISITLGLRIPCIAWRISGGIYSGVIRDSPEERTENALEKL